MAVARSEASLAANPVDVHRATDAVLAALDELTTRHPYIITVATSNFTTGLDAAFVSRADVAIEVPLPPPAALTDILRDTLKGWAAEFPPLMELARSASLDSVGRLMTGMDGREARKLVAYAAARRLNTATDPGQLNMDDLTQAVQYANHRKDNDNGPK